MTLKIFPKEFSVLNQCQALAIIDEAQRAARAYNGQFIAPWLLSDIHAHVWRISKGDETRDVDGIIINYQEYNWATKLFDGSNLIDPENIQMLHAAQRLAFLARELPGGPTTLTTLRNFLWSLNFLIRWTYLHSETLNPRQFQFSKMTGRHFADLLSGLASGGTVFALRYPERILAALLPAALGRQPTNQEMDDPLSLNPIDCQRVSQWLIKMDAFEKRKRTALGIDTFKRAFLAKLINVDVATLRGGNRWYAFLGQFEASHLSHDDRLASNEGRGSREMPSQKDLSLDEARDIGASTKTVHKYFDDFRTIVALHRHLPNICPSPFDFDQRELRSLIMEKGKDSARTPWVPLSTAMTYTTEALRWVHIYGEDLITLFLSAYSGMYARGLLVSGPIPNIEHPTSAELSREHKILSEGRELFVASLSIPEVLSPLHLSGWNCHTHIDGRKGFLKLREAPSIIDAVMVLVGAITIVVTMVKPMRESEFRALKRDCVIFVSGDGYWLSHDRRKANVDDVRKIDDRPIPVIAAKAIKLLRRLTDGLKEIVGETDPWLLNSLMTLPNFGRYEANVNGVINAAKLCTLLDAFCDYVALPPDNTGRRWYIRIHEMRKSFLITFFWTFRYASLDASRWMAGHSDVSHIYAYIQANFPGDELPGLEAEYAAEVLRDYEHGRYSDADKGVADLYQAVCNHFSVRDVSWIDERTLRDWLEFQFEVKEFQITPYSIKTPDGDVATAIAFRVTSTTNGEDSQNG